MLLSVGTPVYDLITTPFIKTEKRILSGCSTNAAIVFNRMGGESFLAGNLGKDYLEHFSGFLMEKKINFQVDSNSVTAGFDLIYRTITDRELYIWRAAKPFNFIPHVEKKPEFILVGPILNEVDYEYVSKLKEKYSDSVFAIDPQGFLRRANGNHIEHFRPDNIEELLRLFDIIKPNELEAEILTGTDPRKEPEKALDQMVELVSPDKTVVVTLAEKGAVAYSEGKKYFIPAYPSDAKDSTGVGDAFIGSFLYASSKNLSFKEKIAYATTASSFVVEQIGPNFEWDEEKFQERARHLTGLVEEEIPDEV